MSALRQCSTVLTTRKRVRHARGQNGVVHVLKRVVSASSATRPLQHNGHGRKSARNLKRVENRVGRSRLERDISHPASLQRGHNVSRALGSRYPSTDSDALNGHSLSAEPKNRGELESPLLRVEVEEIEGDPCPRLEAVHNLSDRLAEDVRPWKTPTGQFGVEPSVRDRSHLQIDAVKWGVGESVSGRECECENVHACAHVCANVCVYTHLYMCVPVSLCRTGGYGSTPIRTLA